MAKAKGKRTKGVKVPKVTRFYGVFKHKNDKWIAKVTRSKRLGYDGEEFYIGHYKCELSAARAVDAYIQQNCPNMSKKLNFPDSESDLSEEEEES